MGLDTKNNIISVLTTEISSNIFFMATILDFKAVQVFATTVITRIDVDIHIKIMNKLVVMSNILRKVFFVAAILNGQNGRHRNH